MNSVATDADELKLYPLAEAAKMLGVSAKTVMREADRKKITIVKIGKLNMIRVHDLKTYIESLDAA
jgi:excisionase family DNA binding protein